MSNNVHVWEENVTIPTYKVYPPEKGPLFIENRAYQGSSGKVYPLPVTEKISDKKEDVSYHAIYLENDYLKVMVLPELGGRIQRAYDKTNGYDFVYYNHVIKPALVGLAGPWISGGIEFNCPQHHRPTTYMPVDHLVETHEDGFLTTPIFLRPSSGGQIRLFRSMTILTLYSRRMYMQLWTMENVPYLHSRSQPENITNTTTLQALTFPCIRISRCRLLTWLRILTLIL